VRIGAAKRKIDSSPEEHKNAITKVCPFTSIERKKPKRDMISGNTGMVEIAGCKQREAVSSASFQKNCH